MPSAYVLRIYSASPENSRKIDEIFKGVTTSLDRGWELEVEESSELFPRSISYFLDLLDNNIQELLINGVKPSDITIWFYYEYFRQCNMEFEADNLRRMGELGITLCVSCWEEGDDMELNLGG